MTAPETLSTQEASPVIRADPTAHLEAGRSALAASFVPRLMPVAQLLAVVLGVLAIIWNQQQGIDSLRAEFVQAHSELRADFTQAHSELRAEVTANDQRLALIEGHLGIGVPDHSPQ